MPETGPNTEKMLIAWATIVVEKWLDSLELENVNPEKKKDGNLFKAVESMIFDAGADGNKIEFILPLYGIFVDMGVGREISRGNTGNLADKYGEGYKVTRQPKPWYSSVFFKQIKALKILLANLYGDQIANTLIIQLNDLRKEQWANSKTAQQRKIKTTN